MFSLKKVDDLRAREPKREEKETKNSAPNSVGEDIATYLGMFHCHQYQDHRSPWCQSK